MPPGKPKRHRLRAKGWARPDGNRGAAWRDHRPSSTSSVLRRPAAATAFVSASPGCRGCAAVRRLGLARRIHRVGEGDRIQAVLLRILHKFGGDKEDDRHVAFFAGLEPLIGKTEAIDLREICASGGRRDVVAGNSYGLACRLVDDPIADGNDLPDLDG